MNYTAPRNYVDIAPAEASFRVQRSAYRDPEIFALEKELIFGRCWLYLGHGSELKSRGAYVKRTVGGRDLLFVRGADDKLRALYNSCTHRGAAVCREARGTTRNFTCPYHGWVFNTEGTLKSTNAKQGYPAELNADNELNLKQVARLEEYRDFYFVNFNPSAISLYDYLAGAREMIDAIYDQTAGQQVILPGEHSYTVNANYKLLCENSYDGYHLSTVHASYIDFLSDQTVGTPAEGMVQKTMESFAEKGQARVLGNGHAVLESVVPTGRPVAQWNPSWGPDIKVEIDAKRAYLDQQFGKERAAYISDMQKNIVIFPNLVINDILAITVRVIEPEAPDFLRVTAWAMGPEDESDALRAIRFDNFISFLGPAGFGSPDDIEMLESAQRSIEHTPVEWTNISKGMNWSGDPTGHSGPTDGELQMQGYWHMWDQVIRGIDKLEQA